MRTRRGTALRALLPVLAGLGACSGGTAGPAEDPGATTADGLPQTVSLEALATRIDALDADLVVAELEAGPVGNASGELGSGEGGGERHRHWVRSRACPVAGVVEVEGDTWGVRTGPGSELGAEVRARVRFFGCTFDAAGAAFRIDADRGLELSARRGSPEAPSGGSEWTRRVGSFTWRYRGELGTCEVDVATEAEPGSATRAMSGELCGRTFTHRWEWGQESDS